MEFLMLSGGAQRSSEYCAEELQSLMRIAKMHIPKTTEICMQSCHPYSVSYIYLGCTDNCTPGQLYTGHLYTLAAKGG